MATWCGSVERAGKRLRASKTHRAWVETGDVVWTPSFCLADEGGEEVGVVGEVEFDGEGNVVGETCVGVRVGIQACVVRGIVRRFRRGGGDDDGR